MKINLKSNFPESIPTVTVVKLSDINIGDACQMATSYRVGDKLNQTQFNELSKQYRKAIPFQKGVGQDRIKVVLISNLANLIDMITDFGSNTPVIPLDCEINFTVNYNLDNQP